jgi:P4 family phage/plasmid primase-like protien
LDDLEGDIHEHKWRIAAIPCCVFVFISPSGKGLKGALHVASTAIRSDDDFKLLFPQVETFFKHQGYNIDKNCKDVRRLCFLSHDPDLYINWDAEIFDFAQRSALAQTEIDPGMSLVLSEVRGQSTESECIGRVIRILQGAGPGSRHEARLKAGKLAGGFIAGGLIEDPSFPNLLRTVSDSISDNGITDPAEIKTLFGAVEYGKRFPIATLDQELEGGKSLSSGSEVMLNRPELSVGTDARDGTHNTRPLTEYGNALRLLDAHGERIRYVYDAQAWLHWRDGGWCWDIKGSATRTLAANLPDQIYQEGTLHLREGELYAKWARNSQQRKIILASVDLLSDLEPIRMPLALVDADPFLVGLNSARQVIDLRTGTVRAATPYDFVTKSLAVQYLGESSQAWRFHAFLKQVFAEDQELISWLKRWCGYLLTGSTDEQILLFCYGLGANGKSVLAEILRYVLGDYARAIASESLTESKRQAGSASPDIADLIGARLGVSSETEDGKALAESLIKSLVAGDTMTTRMLYSAPVQFKPQFKLMILGNHKPIIKGNDDGIWRRMRLIPFTQTFTEKERDPYLLGKLIKEASHILAWMVEGCLEWQALGLKNVPAIVKQATSDYQEDQDIIGNWLTECCEEAPSHTTASTDLYESYKNWCVSNGNRPYSNVALGRKLSERGFKGAKIKGARCWEGITVKEPFYHGLFN